MQSSNIFIRRGHPVLIDFQGLRRGPAAYDLASLLCDPYVMLDEEIQTRLLNDYLRHTPHPETVADMYWYAATQRLVQALGAFGRLSALPHTIRFARFISPAATMMLRVFSRFDAPPHLTRIIHSLIESAHAVSSS